MDNTTSDIISKERVHRTRTTMLQSSGKVRTWFYLSDINMCTFIV